MKRLIQVLDRQGYSVSTNFRTEEKLGYDYLYFYDFIYVMEEEDEYGNSNVRLYPCMAWERGVDISEDVLKEPVITCMGFTRYLFGFLYSEEDYEFSFELIQEAINFYEKYDKYNTRLKQNFFQSPEEELSLQNICKAFLRSPYHDLYIKYLGGPSSDIVRAIEDMAAYGKLDNKPIRP